MDIATEAHIKRCDVARRRKEVDPLARDSASSSERRRGRYHRRLCACDAPWMLDDVITNVMFARVMLRVVRAGAARREAQARASGHRQPCGESPTKKATRPLNVTRVSTHTHAYLAVSKVETSRESRRRLLSKGNILPPFLSHTFRTHAQSGRCGDNRILQRALAAFP